MASLQTLSRFREMKYGLLIHFGLYSLLGGEWQGKVTPGLAEWIQSDLDIPVQEYVGLADRFDPASFAPREIARKAKTWGMRYLCFTAKHHDGFAMFNSQVSTFNSAQASLCHRDFVAELAAACKAENLTFCLYYSQAQDWRHGGGYRAYHENDAAGFEAYFEDICLPQVRELLSNYGELGMIWFDTPMGMTREQCQTLASTVKALQPDCLINGRVGHGLGDYLTMADNRIPRQAIANVWEVPITLNSSWGYKRADEQWASASETFQKWLKIVSRGGNVLLNLGPRGDGSIPEESLAVLDEVGKFLAANEEAYFGADLAPEYVFECDDLYFTQKHGELYITLLNPGQRLGKTLSLYHMKSIATKARLLSNGMDLPLRVGKDLEGFGHWAIALPSTLDKADQLAWVIKVDLDGDEFEVEALN